MRISDWSSDVCSSDLVCPGFPADCLETLEEIALQNAEVFRAAGGQALSYIPCLNDAPAHADALAALALCELQAWLCCESSNSSSRPGASPDRKSTRLNSSH